MGSMQLNVFMRKAVGTARGVRIRMNHHEFEFSVLSILGFKVRGTPDPANSNFLATG